MGIRRIGHFALTVVAAGVGLAIGGWAPVEAAAKGAGFDAIPFASKKVRLDGLLSEWPELKLLDQTLLGHPTALDPQVRGGVGYDAKSLYVGMSVRDLGLVLGAGASSKQDHVVLAIAFPTRGGGHQTYQLRLHPGDPGKSPGQVVIVGGGAVAGAKLVEAPAKEGFTFEAQIPWSTFAEAKLVRSGLRAALSYHDADSPGHVASIVGTGKSVSQQLPALTLESEYALNNGLVFPKGLDREPDRELFGNVVGDAMLERVAVYDRYLAVTGWNYREGTEFYYQDLSVLEPSSLRRIELQDFTGDGHDDLLIQRRVGTAGDAREFLEVWHFRASNDGPQLIFQHLVGVQTGPTWVSNDVEIKRVQGQPQIVVAPGKHEQLDPSAWNVEPVSGRGLFPLILPWEAVRSRTFGWKGELFELLEERPGKASVAAPNRRTRMSSGTAPLASTDEALSVPPERPRPPSPEELLDGVYALYRSDRGVAAARPRFDFVTNVAGDAENERVLIHDKDIVAFGKHFRTGTSYVYTTVGVKEAADILDVTARDVTGDGRAEVIVRAVIHVQASKQLGGDVVSRHALFIYKIEQSGVTRVFAAETGRSLGEKSILGLIRFVPSGKGLELELLPGRAVEWTEKTYPFPQDSTPYGGLEPLLLPWSGIAPKRYAFDGRVFVAGE
ncbi:MAG: hypothetical protein RJA70_576 [Pseudomonadota bacterium]|jgi:hypothetical protein